MGKFQLTDFSGGKKAVLTLRPNTYSRFFNVRYCMRVDTTGTTIRTVSLYPLTK
jgi:hypothetical protein